MIESHFDNFGEAQKPKEINCGTDIRRCRFKHFLTPFDFQKLSFILYRKFKYSVRVLEMSENARVRLLKQQYTPQFSTWPKLVV